MATDLKRGGTAACLASGRPDDADCLERPDDLVAEPQAYVGGDLVVAAAGGVEFYARLADLADQRRLDVHMDVLASGIPLELARFDLAFDGAQAPLDLCGFRFGEQADSCQPFRVCH